MKISKCLLVAVVAVGFLLASCDTNGISDVEDDKELINDLPVFSKEGADIVGMSETEFWQVECKGAGSGTTQTQRNNFDRALASVVSYYQEEVEGFPDQLKNAQPYLGLALPQSPDYMRQLRKRVRVPLRKTLNLWVLLYDPDTNSVKPISPTDDY